MSICYRFFTDTSPRKVIFFFFGALWVFLAAASPVPAKTAPPPQTSGEISQLTYSRDDAYVAMAIIRSLERYHYSGKRLDDALSAEILHQYLSNLDPAKNLFTRRDIDEFGQIKYFLDNALERGNLNPGYVIFNLYRERATMRLKYILSLVPQWHQTFDFSTHETLSLDRENDPWPASMDALEALWWRELKNDILTRKLDNVPDDEIAPLLEKRYRNRLNRIYQIDENDVFNSYINAVTMSFDPHTQYFPPRVSEDFNIQMSLSLEGIGAVLQTEDEFTKVLRLIPAGPADKSGKLKPGDKIIGVGQGKTGEIQDTLGWRIDEVVKLIRGPRNTIVRLQIIPADKKSAQHARIIHIRRDEVKLEEQAARKKVQTVTRKDTTFKIGIIELPTFYLDFKAYQEGKTDYRSTTRDVLTLIKALKTENIDGLIMDLRDNGGGSLQEVNQLTGLFIKTGPTVQIRSRYGGMSQLDDSDASLAWQGPLMVMINRMSASASEIFAGAIQDYHRGVVVGTRTFGKGTVQAMQSIGPGQLKLTNAKFYRISGESTQNKGVEPDIAYPPLYNSSEIGESALDNALPWDVSTRASFKPYRPLTPLLPLLRKQHDRRTATHPDFAYLKEKYQLSTTLFDIRQLSLNEKTRKQQNDLMDQRELEMENRYRRAEGLPVFASVTEMRNQHQEEDNTDTETSTDLLLTETTRLMGDFIALSREQHYQW